VSFQRYHTYTKSDVDWLCEVPAGWKIMPLKCVFTIVGGSTPKSDVAAFWDGGVPWATPADLSKLASMYISETQRTITDAGLKSCGTTLVPAQSILLSTRAPIGSLAIAATPMCTNQGCKSLVPREGVDPKYFAYLLSISSEQLNSRGKGSTFLEISGDELGAFRVPVPSGREQRLISTFLDRETAKINELAAEQQRLIELLKEMQMAVVSEAVTKGLNPTAPTKPSTTEWLGDIPTHWTVTPIRKVAKLESGHTPSRKHPEYWQNCTIPWFTLSDVWQIRENKSEYVYETKEKVSELGLKESSARLVPKGTVMLSRTASVGFSAIMGCDMATTQDFANWICGPTLLPEFLLFSLRSMDQEFRRLMMGSTHNTIYMPDIQSLRIGLPPIAEQVMIVNYVRAKTAEYETLTRASEQAIGLLMERRNSLISAAVTGQIDVRSVVEPVAA
jgi:type I restriction enzyme, S subunit